MTCDQLDYQSLFVRCHVISCSDQLLKNKNVTYNVCFTLFTFCVGMNSVNVDKSMSEQTSDKFSFYGLYGGIFVAIGV